jgi:uncharacterized peroxidase-related enzyme
MPRLQAIPVDQATGETAALFTAVTKKLGRVPNMVATMAQSPAVANAYVGFSGALAAGQLPRKLREQIALVVGQANGCDYCLAAHSMLGKLAGLSPEAVNAARQGQAEDAQASAALDFAARVVSDRGRVSDADIESLRAVGFNDGDIAEIVAHVALNVFTNYFNHLADPVVDFPAAPELVPTARV